MWNTFKAELKHIFSNKWKFAAFLVLLFIPFIYGFLYMNAYWSPFKHVDRLKIAVVSRDLKDINNVESEQKDLSKILTDQLDGKTISSGSNQIYKIALDQSIIENPKDAVDSGQYAAVIVIPNGYSEGMKIFHDDVVQDAIHGKINLKESLEMANDYIKTTPNIKGSNHENHFDKVTFYFSYKHSYLKGEMINFLSSNTSLILKILFPDASAFATQIGGNSGLLSQTIHKFVDMIEKDASTLINIEKYGYERFDSYGRGLSPYFISIALWAGALATLFIVKNERHIKTENTIKHFFGKMLTWIMIGWIQSTILITAITLQGIKLGSSQWELYLFGYFMATIFPMIVMSSAYTMRYGDIGEFIVVIMLVAQLISSSGTFPVEMQNIIFRIIHPIAPFTYTISTLREIMWDPSIQKIFINMTILMLFPIVIMPLSIYINWRFDVKNRIKSNGSYKYKSFEIHLGDY